MSSVLKALKKLEEEKRGGGTPAVPGNQRWASGGQPERKGRLWLVAGSGLAVALLLVLVLLWAGRMTVPVATAPTGAPVPETVVALPVRPEVPGDHAPVRIEPVPQPVVSTPPVATPQAAAQSMPQPPSQTVPQRKAPRPVPSSPLSAPAPVITTAPGGAVPSPAEPTVKPVAEVPVEIPVRQVQLSRFDIPAPGQEWVAPPQLTVSEILPPTGGERMAIVNGLPVMAGTMVDEALVEEIHDDRVLFAIGDRRVTVPLQKGR